MPIANVQDTTGVEQNLQEILSSADIVRRLQAIRVLFVGTLDYDNADQLVSLESAGNAQLPKDAYLAARRDGVTVAYIPLDNADTNRVNGIVASAAAKALGNILADDLLLVFTNRDRDQLHIISPDLSGSRPKLRRLVAYRDQLQRTVPQQIANMWDNYGNKGKTLREAISEAFSVEPVTREFFETYRKLFEAAKEQITGFTPAEEEQKHLFTQTLFNRLMFVYFLSRKGWLKFTGDPDYLKALWNDYDPESSTGNFYLTRLRTLFFEGLNNPDAGNLPEGEKTLIGEVPFLNGGLFEETALDKRQNIEIHDETIEHILTDLFDRFNFTVMESTTYDVEVAVDPEMLGKVFEELVTGRHDSGAYYTPRPVVSFMCREALKGYLEGKETGLDNEAIALFVDERDTSGISLTAAPHVSQALSEVTVVDPACGSGAYLLGMMQELIELQALLYNIGVDAKKIYDLKLEIIQRNLYGVDIDEFAVNIAMLRMWLSLAIDYEGEEPEPLPNLDFKVVCGDSLLGPNPSGGTEVQGTLGRDMEKIRRLGQVKAKYMRASSREAKARFKAEIEELTQEIREELGNTGASQGVVDWQVEFSEVFAEGLGFNIAIGNPPYVDMVSMDRTNSEYRAMLRSNYSTARGGFDIFVPFIERGIQVISQNGVMAFITPNKLLAAKYAKHVRDFLVKSSQLLSITDLSEVPIFSASVYPVVTVTKKIEPNVSTQTVNIFRTIGKPAAFLQVSFDYSAPLSVALQFGNLWSPLLAPDALDLVPLLENCDRLGDIAAVSASATVGEAYEWKEAVVDQGSGLYLNNPEQYRPFIVSGNVRPYFHTWGQRPVQYIKRQYHSPVLEISHPAISDRRRRQITQEKLIISGMSKRPTCVYDQQGIAAGKSTVLVLATNSDDHAFLCGLLNSELMRRFYLVMFGSLSLAGGFLRFGTPQIGELPIPKTTETERREISGLVLQLADLDPDARVKLQRQIDEAVLALFGFGGR